MSRCTPKVTLRLVIAAVVLLGLVPAARAPGARSRLCRPSGADRAVAVAFGLVLAGMNVSFYEAIARIPLGVAVTVEFSGPLTLALVGSRRSTDGPLGRTTRSVWWPVSAGHGGLGVMAEDRKVCPTRIRRRAGA